MDEPYILETNRLKVRLLKRTDFESLHEICGEPSVMKFVGNLEPYTRAQTRQVILKCLRSYEWHGYGGWALLEKSSASFVGYGGFEFVPSRSMPELFYIFAPQYWGKGYASEFALAAVAYAFGELKLSRLGASFDPSNHASMKVALKAGFAYSYDGLDEFGLPAVYYELTSP